MSERAEIIPISKSDGWLNITDEAALNAGDNINVQNIGSGAVYLSARQLEPVDKNDIDYLLAPGRTISINVKDIQNIWAFTGGFRSTKLSVHKNELKAICDSSVNILNKLDALLELELGIDTAGFKSYSVVLPAPTPGIFGFTNNDSVRVAGEFKMGAGNNANNVFGSLDIQGNLINEALTGGVDFTAAETCEFRGGVNMIAKKSPTNVVDICQFERLYVPANGGATTETISKILMEPGETVLFQVASIVNIAELAFSARFGRS